MLDEATLKLCSRSEIQKMARANGIKGNLKTVVIIQLLVERSKNQAINASTALTHRGVKAEDNERNNGRNDGPAMAASGSGNFGESISTALRVQSVKREQASPSISSGVSFESEEPTIGHWRANVAAEIDAGSRMPVAGASSDHTARNIHAVEHPIVPTDPLDPLTDERHGQPLLTIGSPNGPQPSLSPLGLDRRSESRQNSTGGTPGNRRVLRLPSPPTYSSRSPPSPHGDPVHTMTSLLRTPSPPRPQGAPYSPLPPSSPPRDSTSPAPQDKAADTNDEQEKPLSSERESLVGDARQADIRQILSDNSVTHLRRVSTEYSPSMLQGIIERQQASEHGSDLVDFHTPSDKENVAPTLVQSPPQQQHPHYYELPEADSGDSVYTGTSPEPASDDDASDGLLAPDDLIQRAVDVMASLSQVYRSNLMGCKAVMDRAITLEKDVVIQRREVTQELSMVYRDLVWVSHMANPAVTYDPETLWKQPIEVKMLDGMYLEETTDSEDDEIDELFSHKGPLRWDESGVCHIDSQVADPPSKSQGPRSNKGSGRDNTEQKKAPNGRDDRGEGQETLMGYLNHFLEKKTIASEPARSPPTFFSSSPSTDENIAVSRLQQNQPELPRRKVNALPQRGAGRRRGLGGLTPGKRQHRQVVDTTPPSSPSPMSKHPRPPGLFSVGSPQSDIDDYIDEKSVESILEGLLPSAQEDYRAPNPFLKRQKTAPSGSRARRVTVQVVDEDGEEHERISAVLKGKGKARE
ncbi:hypothetical protein BDW22DRAFT_1202054 [Trametopsis cervina]|nr:hypothetical protein BDW22DRAFT_1202054 [Trametopsis cervina]